MLYIHFILGAFFSACLVVILRLFSRYNVPAFPAVVGNYITCAVIGVCLDFSHAPIGRQAPSTELFVYTLLLGALFIGTFYMMALSAEAVGVTLTSVFAKISMVIPILFSLFILRNATFDFWNYLGLVLAGVAVIVSSWKDSPPASETQKKKAKISIWAILLPLSVFLCSGIIDTSLNFLNSAYSRAESPTALPILIFAAAAWWGILVLCYQFLVLKKKPPIRAIWGGIALGIPNFFSLYFIVKSLSDFDNNGALFFPLFNIAIILFAALGGWIIFKEKLSTLNKIGVLLALVAIGLIAYQEIK